MRFSHTHTLVYTFICLWETLFEPSLHSIWFKIENNWFSWQTSHELIVKISILTTSSALKSMKPGRIRKSLEKKRIFYFHVCFDAKKTKITCMWDHLPNQTIVLPWVHHLICHHQHHTWTWFGWFSKQINTNKENNNINKYTKILTENVATNHCMNEWMNARNGE